jgi:hypothetical protein
MPTPSASPAAWCCPPPPDFSATLIRMMPTQSTPSASPAAWCLSHDAGTACTDTDTRATLTPRARALTPDTGMRPVPDSGMGLVRSWCRRLAPPLSTPQSPPVSRPLSLSPLAAAFLPLFESFASLTTLLRVLLRCIRRVANTHWHACARPHAHAHTAIRTSCGGTSFSPSPSTAASRSAASWCVRGSVRKGEQGSEYIWVFNYIYIYIYIYNVRGTSICCRCKCPDAIYI